MNPTDQAREYPTLPMASGALGWLPDPMLALTVASVDIRVDVAISLAHEFIVNGSFAFSIGIEFNFDPILSVSVSETFLVLRRRKIRYSRR